MRRRIREVIVVEGRYDKNTVSQLVDTMILETNGFGIFSDSEKQALLRRLAAERGVILLTDSDSAGFLIRGHLKGILGTVGVKQAYIPDIPGKERRKRRPGKEGLIGVEGAGRERILKALEDCGATFLDGTEPPEERGGITKTDLYLHRLSGAPDSAKKRSELCQRLGLPARMTANALLEALNLLYSKMEFERLF